MSKTGQNLIVVLGIVLTVFAAYYFFTQESPLGLNSTQSGATLEVLLQDAQLFSERQAVLNGISLDTSVLSDEVFVSLQDYTEQPEEYRVGRPDPFLPTAFEPVITSVTDTEAE